MGKGTTALGKPTGAPRATGPDEARRTSAGHKTRQRGTPPATTKAHGQMPSNNGHGVPQTRAARTTRTKARHRNRCQATPNPQSTNPKQERRGTTRRGIPAHTPQHPCQEWRGAAESQAQAHTPTEQTQARSGRVQAEGAQRHTRPNTPVRSGGAQPKPEPTHTHPQRTPQPGVVGYKRSAHTNTHTPQRPGQEWQGAAKTRPQAHTPTPHISARSGGVQAERAHKHTHTPTPQPGVARRSGNQSPGTHTHTAHPS